MHVCIHRVYQLAVKKLVDLAGGISDGGSNLMGFHCLLICLYVVFEAISFWGVLYPYRECMRIHDARCAYAFVTYAYAFVCAYAHTRKTLITTHAYYLHYHE
jgi:hypothetical protein